MKRNELKLTQLSKYALDTRQENALKGGGSCICVGCACVGDICNLLCTDDGKEIDNTIKDMYPPDIIQI